VIIASKKFASFRPEVGDDGEFTRRLESGDESRDLHGRHLFSASATFDITYTCTFCSRENGLADDLTRCLEAPPRNKKAFDPDLIEPHPYEPWYETSPDGGNGNGGGAVLSSEDDSLKAYSDAIQALNDLVAIDVIFLEEIDLDNPDNMGSKKGSKKLGSRG
jgi:hypothetical protein